MYVVQSVGICRRPPFTFLNATMIFQHYHKTHAKKVFFCEKCKKGFVISSELKAHVRSCGSTFACSCGYEYSTRAALLTHAKRKMHVLPNEQQPGNRQVNFLRNLKWHILSIINFFHPLSYGIDSHFSGSHKKKNRQLHHLSSLAAAFRMNSLTRL